MGLFGFGKEPDKNVPVLVAKEDRQRLLALNRETGPIRSFKGVAFGKL